MFILQRATETLIAPDEYAGDDATSQETEYAGLSPSGKQVATMVGISIAALIGLLAGIYAFYRAQQWYRTRRRQRKDSIQEVRGAESIGEPPQRPMLEMKDHLDNRLDSAPVPKVYCRYSLNA
jgi:hypothetical protein